MNILSFIGCAVVTSLVAKLLSSVAILLKAPDFLAGEVVGLAIGIMWVMYLFPKSEGEAE